MLHNKMCTYVQVKNAFSYFYPKRKVLEDGVSVIPLDISIIFHKLRSKYMRKQMVRLAFPVHWLTFKRFRYQAEVKKH